MISRRHKNTAVEAQAPGAAGLATVGGKTRSHALPTWISSVLRILVPACAIIFVAGYLTVASVRVRYPFELEWMEGSMVEAVRRLLIGQKLYARPSVEYVPYLYPPLYFYLSALAAAVTGIGFFPLRLVSIVASLGCLGLIYLIVAQQTESRFCGIVAAGLFAATYKLSGYWFDVGRVDSTYLCFLLAAAYVINFGSSKGAPYLAGGLIWLAFLSKQTALAMAAPLMLYYLLISWRDGIRLAATVIVLLVSSTALLNWLNDGWYTYYIFAVPSTHPLESALWLGFWRQDILGALPIGVLVALSYFVMQGFRPERRDLFFYLALAGGLVLGAWGGRLNQGGYLNTLMPAYAAIAVLVGVALGQAARLWPRSTLAVRSTVLAVLYGACLVQLGLLYSDPRDALPTANDLQDGRQLLQAIRDLPGDVYVPFHGYLASMAGKKSYAHAMPVADFVNMGPDGVPKTKLVEEFKDAVASQKFGAIILDQGKWKGWLPGDAGETYTLDRPVFKDEAGFWPVTGYRTKPSDLLLPLPIARTVTPDVAWQDDIRLVRARLPNVKSGQKVIPLVLVWRGGSPIAKNWKVFVALLDENGKTRAQADSYPDRGNALTTDWQPGEEIIDRHDLQADGGLGPGTYRVRIGLYDEATGVRLPLAGGGDAYELLQSVS